MNSRNKRVEDNAWSAIPIEEPDEIDLAMISEMTANDDEQSLVPAKEVSRRLEEIRTERKKKGDLHVRIASSLHEEIVDDAMEEGISLNQYVATALAYYAGVRRNINNIKK